MRRPGPPPPQSSEDVELDYGSAEASGSGSQLVAPGEALSRNEVDAPTASRGRTLLAYETEHLDATAPPAILPLPEGSEPFDARAPPASDPFRDNAFTSPEEGAVAEPSSPDGPAYNFSPYESLGGAFAGHADLHPPPPPPIYPPPDLQHASPAHYAYDPNAPAFHPAQPAFDHTPSDRHTFEAAAMDHYPAGSNHAYAGYEPSYGPRAPYDSGAYRNPELYGHSYAAYPSASTSFHPSYTGTFNGAYPTGYTHFQMVGYRPQNLLKQQKKQERKQRKREKKQLKLAAKIAAHNAHLDAYKGASSSANVADAAYGDDVDWAEDGKSQAVAMVKELDARGVPPQRLTEKGVPLRMIEACCSELGISTLGEARQDVNAPETSSPPPATSKPNSVEEEGQIVTTPAEDAVLAKQEQGVALTPLEELRKKVLASRMAKVAAASAAASSANEPAAAVIAAPTATTNVFDRTATSGEADALLSQIGESMRGLIRPSREVGVAIEEGVIEDSSNDTALPSSRKRAYRDVDAVDDGDDVVTADLAGDENASIPLASRRQRISYADNFSRAAKAPSGEVDLNAPVPDLPDLAMSATKSPLLSDAASRRRPVAADFDADEYVPQLLRPNRFLDVPSDLNTVVDLSDDDLEEDEPNAFEMSKYSHLAVDASDVALLRQKTADEHYDTFCALNGLRPVSRALTPLQDGPNKMVESTNGAILGGYGSKESLSAEGTTAAGASAGTSAPSHEELLRKELEIKQLMRKIQMMEERKSKQQGVAVPSSSASPMPSRSLQSADTTQAPPDEPLTTTVQAVGVPATVIAAPAPSEGVEKPRKSVQQSSANAVKLDAALQQKREELLASLASKRKSSTAAKVSNGVTQDEPLNEVATASKQDHVKTAPSNGIPSESVIIAKSGDREEVSFPDSSTSRIASRPLTHLLAPAFALTRPIRSHRNPPWSRGIDPWCRVCSRA